MLGQNPPNQPANAGASPVSPAATPLQQAGLKAKAIAQVQMAQKILEMSLPLVGADSPEGEAILKSLTHLTKHFGKQSNISEQQVAHLLMQQQAINALKQRIALQAAAQRQMQAQQMQQQQPQQGGII